MQPVDTVFCWTWVHHMLGVDEQMVYLLPSLRITCMPVAHMVVSKE